MYLHIKKLQKKCFQEKNHTCTSRNVIYMQNLEKNTVGFEFNKINVSVMNMILRIYLFCDIEIS